MDSRHTRAVDHLPAHPAEVPPHKLRAWVAFLEAHARTVELLTRELKDEEGLALSWYDVLVQLSEADDGQLRMQDLADAVLLSKSGLTRLIDRMETAGLVRREACPSDRRGTFAAITEEGMRTLRATYPTHARGVRQHFTDLLDDDEARVLERILRRIAEGSRVE